MSQMNEVLTWLLGLLNQIVVVMWFIVPFLLYSGLKEANRQLKHIHWELRKLNNKGEEPSRPTREDLEHVLGGPER